VVVVVVVVVAVAIAVAAVATAAVGGQYISIYPCVAYLTQRFARSNSCPPPCTRSSNNELSLGAGVARDNCYCCFFRCCCTCTVAAVTITIYLPTLPLHVPTYYPTYLPLPYTYLLYRYLYLPTITYT
jgi:hypothetical protein